MRFPDLFGKLWWFSQKNYFRFLINISKKERISKKISWVNSEISMEIAHIWLVSVFVHCTLISQSLLLVLLCQVFQGSYIRRGDGGPAPPPPPLPLQRYKKKIYGNLTIKYRKILIFLYFAGVCLSGGRRDLQLHNYEELRLWAESLVSNCLKKSLGLVWINFFLTLDEDF